MSFQIYWNNKQMKVNMYGKLYKKGASDLQKSTPPRILHLYPKRRQWNLPRYLLNPWRNVKRQKRLSTFVTTTKNVPKHLWILPCECPRFYVLFNTRLWFKVFIPMMTMTKTCIQLDWMLPWKISHNVLEKYMKKSLGQKQIILMHFHNRNKKF